MIQRVHEAGEKRKYRLRKHKSTVTVLSAPSHTHRYPPPPTKLNNSHTDGNAACQN